MAYFTYDKDGGSDLLPEGDYEAVIEKITQKTTPSGKEKLGIQYRIRSDVEQTGKNRVIFEDVWKDKENPQVYNRKRLNQLLATTDTADNTSFDTLQDVIEALEGTQLVIHIKKEFDEYQGKDINRVSFLKRTAHGAESLPSASSTAAEDFFGDIDKCPF